MRILARTRIAASTLAVLVGAVLLPGPFASPAGLRVGIAAGLIAIAGVAATRTPAGRRPGRSAAAVAGWLLAALVVAVWPAPTVRVLAGVAGAALVAGGALGVAAALPGHGRRIVVPAAGAVLGTVLLVWPGVTAYLVAVVVGVPVMAAGLAAELRAGPDRHRRARVVAAGLVLVLAVGLLAVGLRLREGLPHPDAFYTPPAGVPATPGALLRSEPAPRSAPPAAHAWRILYTTTRDDRTPGIASALVLAGDHRPAGPRPVLAWAHGATGITPGCAPSLLPDPLGSGAMPGLDQVLAAGWVVVATDYPGLGTGGPHPFLIGQGEARAVLDGVRAARLVPGIALGTRTVVWGHSQGGNAALWAGILAPTYAPDVGVIGVAALAPGSNLPALARIWGTGRAGAAFAAYLIQAYAENYPDVRFAAYVRPTAAIPVHELADRCLADPKVYLSGMSALLFGRSIWATDPTTGAFGARLRENVPSGPIAVPVLIGQGDADTSVTAASQADYVHGRCASGEAVDYRTYPGRTHVGLIAPDSPVIPELLQWTADRLGGVPARSTCPV